MSVLRKLIPLLLCVTLLTFALASCYDNGQHDHETNVTEKTQEVTPDHTQGVTEPNNEITGDPAQHTHTLVTVTENRVDSTCTKTGSYVEVVCCSVCDERISITQKTIDKKAHDYSQKVMTNTYLKTAATCMSKAVYFYSCVCGEKGTLTFTDGELAEHIYDQKNTSKTYLKSPATETDSAVYYYSCVCGDKGTSTFTYGGELGHTHTFNQKNTEPAYRKSPATCTEAALYYYSCTCGAKGTGTFEYGSVIPHTYDQKNTSSTYRKSPATCTEAALYYYSCTCGAKGTATFSYGSILPHTEGEWIVDKDPTSNEPGVKYTACTVCGEKLKEELIPATGALAYEVNSDGKTCTITGMGTCKDTDVHIPSKIDGYTVTAIGNRAFSECTAITSINIPTTVKTIGLRAFYGCTGITEITIPSSVTSIGTQILYKASNLHTVYYNSTYYSEDNQFLNLDHITKIVFGGSSVPEYMLKSHTAVREIEVLPTVDSVGFAAFSGCSNLTSITMPYAHQRIERYGYYPYYFPFGYIFGTESYTGGVATEQYYEHGSDSIETEQTTYYIPASLQSVTIRAGSSTSIFYRAFYNCSNLKSVTIDGRLYKIDEEGFYGCTSLTSIEMLGSVEIIGKYAFEGCKSLTSIEMGNSVKSIGYSAFLGCTSLTSVEMGNSVTSIGGSAFSGCKSLTSITIPDSVTSIGSYAFYYCTSLTSVEMGNSVTSIGYRTFYGCTSLTSIEIPDSVTIIGGEAFYDCTSLTSIEIPDSVTSIGDYAFCRCKSLTSIEIPDSVTSIGEYAFSGCSSLVSVNITDIAAWCRISFSNYYSNPLYFAKNLYLGGTLVKDLTIPNGVTSIGNAFRGCTSLTSINIPDSVTSIDSGAFSGCSSLESITLPFVGNKVNASRYTNQYLFGYIFGTTSYTGGTATKQDYYGSSDAYDRSTTTFYIPTSLKHVTITGGNLFYGAFLNCTSLESVTIGNGVTSIGKSAFSGCTSLTSIKYRGTISQWEAIKKETGWNTNTGSYTITYNYTDE